MRTAVIATSLTLWLASGGAQALPVYGTQTFESGTLGSEWSGAGSIQSTEGLSAFGFGSLHLKNDGQAPSILSLSGLAAHTSMTLSFSLAMWDSIDFGSDTFQVSADAGFVINQTFGNYFPASGCEGPGTPLTPPTNGSFTDPQLGYNPGFRDCGRAVSITFAHSLATASLAFRYPDSQGAPDEAFGIDNVLVETNAVSVTPGPGNGVPEPASIALVGLGLAAFGITRRRKKA